MTFSLADIHRVGEILALAARTEIMPRFRKLQAKQIRQKSSPFDLVTEADEAAESAVSFQRGAIVRARRNQLASGPGSAPREVDRCDERILQDYDS